MDKSQLIPPWLNNWVKGLLDLILTLANSFTQETFRLPSKIEAYLYISIPFFASCTML